tara:strand:+ start:1225 stop:1668 length:444 start_codon:yes stop_codon:yes gene_type:complete
MDTIMNPRTGRMVKRTGTIGRALVVACSQGCAKKAKAPPKAKAPKKKKRTFIVKPAPAKEKKLSKADFIDEFDNDQMKKGLFGLPDSYDDIVVSYRDDYPRMAKTEKQMDKLTSYSQRQVNKQLYDHYKAKGDLKTFKLKNIYGKAF